MKRVILSYDNEGRELTRIVKAVRKENVEPKLAMVLLTKENELHRVALTVENSDDINECIRLLKTQPRVINRNEHRVGATVMYETKVTDVNLEPLMDELIEELPSVYN